jgi:DNA (cytosine-5)-methyltransferase 1
VVENVVGLRTSNGGADIAAIRQAYEAEGYDCEIAEFDAKYFVAQSRRRLFIIGVRREFGIDVASYVARAREALPPQSSQILTDIIDPFLPCFPAAKTAEIIGTMEPLHLARIEEARRAGKWMVGTYSMRARKEAGVYVPHAEVRFDVASALRTIGGGSSRLGLMAVNGAFTRARLLSPREAARAMGLPDTYRLPVNVNDALSLIGDGVSPPVVRHLARHLLEPILEATVSRRSDVA